MPSSVVALRLLRMARLSTAEIFGTDVEDGLTRSALEDVEYSIHSLLVSRSDCYDVSYTYRLN